MAVVDKNEIILNQYNLGINKIYRVKGAIVLDTRDGLKILREYKASEGKALAVNSIIQHLVASGFTNVDCICTNVNGKLITENQYGNKYVIRHFFSGEECNLGVEQDALDAAEQLAKLHTVLKGVEFSCYTNSNCENERKIVECNTNVVSTRENLGKEEAGQEEVGKEVVGKEVVSKEVVSKEVVSKEVVGKEQVDKEEADKIEAYNIVNVLGDENEYEEIQAASIDEENIKKYIVSKRDIRKNLSNHSREMKRVYRYICDKKKKNDFEVALLNAFPVFKGQSELAIEQLNSVQYDKLLAKSYDEGRMIHGEYTHHNITFFIDSDEQRKCAITGFEKAAIGIQIYDLYHFLRKLMEKNTWNIEYGKKVVDRYINVRKEQGFPVEYEELKVLYALLYFPEKLWKITDYYYNRRKSWMSYRMSEKLKEVVRQEEKRQEFISNIYHQYLYC